MSADQIAELSPIVREIFSSDSPSPDLQLCATIEVVGYPDAWLQVVPGTLNFAYPISDDPATFLKDILTSLPDSSVVFWEPGKFVTAEFGPIGHRAVATAIDALLTKIFSLGDYSVDTSIEEISA